MEACHVALPKPLDVKAICNVCSQSFTKDYTKWDIHDAPVTREGKFWAYYNLAHETYTLLADVK